MAYAIPDGRVAMAATTYTGTGANASIVNTINGVSFQPDFVWIKNRTTGYNHVLQDSIRGATAAAKLSSNLLDVEGSSNLAPYGNVSAFNSNGFSLVAGSIDSRQTNNGSETFIGWQWKAGGTAVSNTAGTITSSVSANTTTGFSVVTYTGTGPAATVGHGLGVAPSFIIIKSRSNSDNWYAYHSSIGNTVSLNPNLSDAAYTSSTYWNNTSPTASVFTIGTIPSQSGWTYIAYCWAAVPGYSAFGSYTGNGSADGPFIYTGFRPRWLMIKNSSAAGFDWIVYDSSRNTYNAAGTNLRPNTSGAEGTQTANLLDFVSNGIKIRGDATGSINTAATYIYAAFAENPLKYANAR